MHLRDALSLDDVGDVTAPGPVEVGDLVATAEGLYRVEAVIPPAPGDGCVAALARARRVAVKP